jgi:signal transduction histidine kinase
VESILAKALGQNLAQSAAEEKRGLLERLLARLAHEIRNPLSSLDVHVQLLDEDLTTLAPGTRDQLGARLSIIRGELHRLESIVSQFLRLTGPSALDLEPVDAAKLICHVCDLLRPEAQSRGIELIASSFGNLPPIRGDSVHLTQALLNLVINAMQAVERTGRIEVISSATEEMFSIAVRDNGPGLPEDKMALLFDPFFTTKAEGHGLGLWIAQQIITAHGGRLVAQNHEQGGAVFTLVLPIRAAQVPSSTPR